MPASVLIIIWLYGQQPTKTAPNQTLAIPTMTIPFYSEKACLTALKEMWHIYGDDITTLKCVDTKTGLMK